MKSDPKPVKFLQARSIQSPHPESELEQESDNLLEAITERFRNVECNKIMSKLSKSLKIFLGNNQIQNFQYLHYPRAIRGHDRKS